MKKLGLAVAAAAILWLVPSATVLPKIKTRAVAPKPRLGRLSNAVACAAREMLQAGIRAE